MLDRDELNVRDDFFLGIVNLLMKTIIPREYFYR